MRNGRMRRLQETGVQASAFIFSLVRFHHPGFMWDMPCVKRFITVLALWLWLADSSVLLGQNEPVSVLNVNNGLPGGYILSALTDSRGFLWIGGSDGLSRYDGLHIVRYAPDPSDPGAIHSGSIYQMVEDQRHHLFILGDRGLEVFLPEENQFRMIQSHIPGNSSYCHFWLREDLRTGFISELSQGDVIPFDLDHLTTYTDRTACPATVLSYMDSLWLMKTNMGQYPNDIRFATDTLNFNIDRFYALTGPVNALGKEGENIWVANHHLGFYRFRYGDPTPEWIPLKGPQADIPESTRMFFFDYNDTLGIVFAEGYGLFSFHKQTGQIERSWDLRHNRSIGRWTSGEVLCKDAAGRVWLTIMPYGIFVLDPLSPEFKTLRNAPSDGPLYNGLLRSMACDTAGYLWLGYHDGTLQVLDPATEKEIFLYQRPSGSEAQTLHPIIALGLHPQGYMLANEQTGFKLDGHNFHAFADPDHCLPPSYGNYFTSLQKPKRRAFVTDTVGPVCQFAIKDQYGIHRYVFNLDYNTVPGLFLTAQNLLLCVYDDVIITASFAQGDTLQLYQVPGTYKVKSFYQSEGSDSVWMATTHGLYIFHVSSRSVTRIPTDNWPDQNIYGLIPDDHGRFWISSNGGLVRYDPQSRRWKRFDVHDGLQSNEFNTNCFARLKDDRLAFGGPEGINIFDPAYFDDRQVPFYVYGTSIRVQDSLIRDFNPFASGFSLSMRPGEKSIEIEYSSTLFFDREDIRYQVQLEGADHDWVDMGNKEIARYINLRPGPYVFRVRAVNADGQWSANVFETRIRMLPAFYQTFWFALLCVLVVASILYALYLYRIRQLRRLESVRNRISHDLHDDVGSTLGSISIYSEVAKQMDPGDQPVVLDKIGEASREMIEKLNDIVWSINPQNDSFEKLESRMRGYAAMVLQPAGIAFVLDLDPELKRMTLDMDDRRNLFLIFKEAIYNTAKYARGSEVRITIKKHERSVTMDIEDNGVGFDPGAVQAYNGNGLRSMRERAMAMKAELLIRAVSGQGTTIHLKLPL